MKKVFNKNAFFERRGTTHCYQAQINQFHSTFIPSEDHHRPSYRMLHHMRSVARRGPSVRMMLSRFQWSERRGDVDNVTLGKEIYDVFSGKRDRSVINKFMDEITPYINLHNVSTLLRVAGKNDIKMSPRHLTNLQRIIEEDYVDPADEVKVFSSLIYGLKAYDEAYDGVPALLAAIREKLAAGVSSMDGQFFGNALYGLQQMSAAHSEVLALIDILAQKLYLSKGEMDAQGLGNALYGLRCMNNDSPEVNRVLHALSQKLESTPDVLEPRHIANALYGLQKMSHITPELEELWTQMAPHMKRFRGEFTAQNVSNAYCGFSGLKSFKSAALCTLLAPLNNVLLIFPLGELDDRAIVTIFQCLGSAECEIEEVRYLIGCIGKHVRRCKADFSDVQLRRILNSVSGMSSDYAEVRSLVKALAWRLSANKSFTIQYSDVPATVWALRGMNSESKEVGPLLSVLMAAFPPAPKMIKLQNMDHLYDAKDIARLLGGLKLISPDTDRGAQFISHVLNLIGPVQNAGPGVLNWKTNAHDVHIALNALHGKHLRGARVPEIVQLVSYLLKRSTAPDETLSAAGLMRSLHSLNTLLYESSSHDDLRTVNALLAILSPKILNALKGPKGRMEPKPLTREELADVCCGLRWLDNRNSHVQFFLRVIKSYHRRIGISDSPALLCKYLSGMPQMNWFQPAVGGLLNELTKLPLEDVGDLHGQNNGGDFVKLFFDAMFGCRRLSAATQPGTTILRILADLTPVITSSECVVNDPAVVCSALSGLRGFCDTVLDMADLPQRELRLSHVYRIASVLLDSLMKLDKTPLSPLQYGCALMAVTDLLPYYLSSDDAKADDLLFLVLFEKVVSEGNAALEEWHKILKESEDSSVEIITGKAVASKKRPVVTSTDLVLLRQALHMTLTMLGEVSGMTAPEKGDEILIRLNRLCQQSLDRVDQRRISEDVDDNEGAETDGPSGPAAGALVVSGLAYAEMKHTKLRKRFRNYLAQDCLEQSSHLIVPKLNPTLMGIFLTDIILTYDKNGADLSAKLDLGAPLPYHFLLNPDIFHLYTAENSDSVHNIVIDIERKGLVFSSSCGMDSQLRRDIKYRYLRKVLGSDNVACIPNSPELKEIEGAKHNIGFAMMQLNPVELKQRKLLLYFMTLEDFENLAVSNVLSSIMKALDFPEKSKDNEGAISPREVEEQ